MAISDRGVWLAKNSDREPGEAQAEEHKQLIPEGTSRIEKRDRDAKQAKEDGEP